MDMQELVSEFLASEHGSQATQALADQGINADDAQQMLGQVAETAHAHVEEQGAGLLGEHPGKSFFAAFAAGLVKGSPATRHSRDVSNGTPPQTSSSR
ncbi:hypothetical protein BCAR13_10151 [Paraburkholderia caribensis]|uniref:hypothetical protein n=1 Tax=Paraburkholderia caribensis TaxID=75105 RepID=UPI001CB04F91|nr:hypothetical protein [Paraburkholderia caribensis]CAG9189259.1 hypothetical protein BCAR13_10151 [Paraburkholderia caribensis]